jgi:hypothetical protein
MNRRSVFSLSAITLLGLALLPGTALPQQKSLKEQLIGTWAYVSSTAKLRDGSPLWGGKSQRPLYPHRQRSLFLANLSLGSSKICVE